MVKGYTGSGGTAGGWFSGAPRFQAEGNRGIPIDSGRPNESETTCFSRPPGHFIRVQRAPEPDEIWYVPRTYCVSVHWCPRYTF